MAKISIDFGTSFSTAAYLNPNTNRPDAIIFNDNGSVKIPSVVFLAKEDMIVGQSALDQASDAVGMSGQDRMNVLSSTIFSVKSKLQPNGFVYANGKSYSHEDIVAAIIKKIKKEATDVCGFKDALTEVTITHPVAFEPWKKDLLVNAAHKAGFSTVSLLEEPVAAAVGYIKSMGISSDGILVYDFGGGTFDVAYVRKSDDGKYQIPIQPLGIQHCGGDDIDRLIYNTFDNLSLSVYSRHISDNPAMHDACFMLRCRKIKEALSRTCKDVRCKEIHPNDISKRLELTMKYERFEEMISPLIDKTMEATSKILDEISRLDYPLDNLILIGGSSRLPLVSKKLQKILPEGKRPEPIMQTDVAVALGGIYDDSIYGQTVGMNKYIYCIYCGTRNDYNNIYCLQDGRKLFKL